MKIQPTRKSDLRRYSRYREPRGAPANNVCLLGVQTHKQGSTYRSNDRNALPHSYIRSCGFQTILYGTVDSQD